MVNRKPIRTRGKLQLSRYFQELNKGDFVAISREKAIQSSFPKRFQGITGVVEEKRGKAYIIKIKDGNKDKQILIEPIHLKKIKQIKKNDRH
jgi:large subunit ribosomal protein L21e